MNGAANGIGGAPALPEGAWPALLELPVLRLAVRARPERPYRLPEFLGSTLRGAFGHALKRMVCMRSDGRCEVCAVRAVCPYPVVFEPLRADGGAGPRTPPAPYVLAWPERDGAAPPPRPDRGGADCDLQPFGFTITLFGYGGDHGELVAFAFGKALHSGLGGRRIRCEILDIQTLPLDDTPPRAGVGPPEPLERWLRRTGAAPRRLVLRLLTPLRLQQDGRLFTEAQPLPFELLVRAGLRRLALLGAPAPDDLAERLRTEASRVQLSRERVRWRDWRRRSGRQQALMELGGLVGELVYDGDLALFAPLLRALELTHLGKQTGFGLGRIEVRFEPGAEGVAVQRHVGRASSSAQAGAAPGEPSARTVRVGVRRGEVRSSCTWQPQWASAQPETEVRTGVKPS